MVSSGNISARLAVAGSAIVKFTTQEGVSAPKCCDQTTKIISLTFSELSLQELREIIPAADPLTLYKPAHPTEKKAAVRTVRYMQYVSKKQQCVQSWACAYAACK